MTRTADEVQTYNLDTLYGFCFMTVSEDVVCSWRRMSSAVGKKITKLKDVVHHLQSKCEAVNKRTLNLQKNPYIKMRDSDILASL
jgi:hypothetical protein